MGQKFSGKRAIITGAASGIGAATMQRLTQEGASVIGVDTAPAKGSDHYQWHQGDVSDESLWQRLLQDAEQEAPIDILINCAGISGDVARPMRYSLETFDKVMAVNTRSIFLGTKFTSQLMKKHGGGSIVNVSSVAGQSGGNHVFGYSASKHAVNGLTRSAANSLARYGIRVNAVAPSQTDTQMMSTMESDLSPDDPTKARDRMVANIPMGRYARAEEVAAAICFLASDDASFVTGAILPVDGGYLTTI